MRLIVIPKDFTHQLSVTVQLVSAGVLISMAWNSPIHVQEENRIVVSCKSNYKIYIIMLKGRNYFDPLFTEEVINNAETIISDDEDDESDDEDSTEGSADNLLVF